MWRNFFIILEFEGRALFSDKPGILRMFIEPLAYLFLLTAGLGSAIANNMDSSTYISFVYPGILALQAFRTFVHSTYRLTIDRRWGLQALKMAAGTSRCAYILGHAIIPIGLCVVQMIITYPCALLLGAVWTIKGFLLLILVGMISALFWTALATVITFSIKKYSQRDFIINFLFLPMSLSAPIFYSLEKAPKYLQVIGNTNPLSYQVNAMREAFLNGYFSVSFCIVAIASLIMYTIAFKTISKAEFLPSENG